jgi:predicted RNA binding protein YcfA (HicA-like mRNA interferase family)
MKRKDVIKMLEQNGWMFKRNNGGHDIYNKQGSSRPIALSRQREIAENIVYAIKKEAGIK